MPQTAVSILIPFLLTVNLHASTKLLLFKMPTGVRVVDDFMEDVEKGEDTVTQTNPTSVNTSEDVMIIDVDEEEKRKPTDDSDDEEDEVVSTYEVFLSHTLQKDLHVLQFPMRPMTRPYDFKSLKAMTYKPNHRKLDLTFEVNKHTEHFNPNFAESDSTFQLTSNVVPMKTNYAVGIIRGTQLHITPLQSMLQLRPSTEKHAEVASTGKEKVSKAKVKKEEEGGAPPKPAQIIASSFRTQADEKERQKTWSYIKQQETEERAITLEHKVKLESDAIIQQLFDTYGTLLFAYTI
jgi:DNA-directed RNA polymerase-3 subunit RPC5